jgi:ATP-dependent Clp protease ATP-binding subunit ClpC
MEDASRRLHLTRTSKHTVALAEDVARDAGRHHVATEHLLLALLEQDDSVAVDVLLELGVDESRVRVASRDISPSCEHRHVIAGPYTAMMRSALAKASTHALALGCSEVSPEHMLLALAHMPDSNASRVLERLGTDLDTLAVELTRAHRERVAARQASLRCRARRTRNAIVRHAPHALQRRLSTITIGSYSRQ